MPRGLTGRQPERHLPRLAEPGEVWFDEFGRSVTVKETSIENITVMDAGRKRIIHRRDWENMRTFEEHMKELEEL